MIRMVPAQYRGCNACDTGDAPHRLEFSRHSSTITVIRLCNACLCSLYLQAGEALGMPTITHPDRHLED